VDWCSSEGFDNLAREFNASGSLALVGDTYILSGQVKGGQLINTKK